MKHEAIYQLYSSVKSINDNEDGTIFAADENGDEVSIDIAAVDTKAAELQTAWQAEKERATRDQMLKDCDWMVISHLELGTPIPQDVKDYRQALRDVPQQPDFPEIINWPSM